VQTESPGTQQTHADEPRALRAPVDKRPARLAAAAYVGADKASGPRRPPRGGLSVAQAIALGAVHGPAELLPVSSSAHIGLLPWLLRWDYPALDGELRKSFEVGLHAGAAAALMCAGCRGRARGSRASRSPTGGKLRFAALAAIPPALAGALFERPVERRLGAPVQLGTGLLAGAALLLWAERRPGRRRAAEANGPDALLLGGAQALALVPGISRAGAAWSAARARGFAPVDAWRLQRQAALPVLAGAAALKGLRLAHRGLPAGLRAPFAAGAASSLLATLAAHALLARSPQPRVGALVRYRIALAALVFARGLDTRASGAPARTQANRAAPSTQSRTIGA
jgi:undecaprenyl-diphosphatase